MVTEVGLKGYRFNLSQRLNYSLNSYFLIVLNVICFLKLLKDYFRGELVKFIRGPRIYFATSRIYWSVFEVMLKYYWRILNCKKSSKSFFEENGNKDS
jgi:hypothetical protein